MSSQQIRNQEKGFAMKDALRKIWMDILGVENIGVDDDFFDMGATSIHVILFINTIQNMTGKLIGFEVLKDGATIRSVANQLDLEGVPESN